MRKLLLLALLLAANVAAIADHLPESLMARGNPEDTLAGINLRTTTAEDVLKKFGPPSRKVKVPNNPAWTGYLWRSGNTQLAVEVSRGKGRDYVETITVVRLNETSPSPANTLAGAEATGRGLKLGDTVDSLKSIYGNRLKLDKQVNVPPDTEPFLSVPGTQTATVQWMKLDFTLIAGLDSQGRIIAMQLRLPSCYPGGCK